MLRVTVLSARNLWKSPTNNDVSPILTVYACGASVSFLGKDKQGKGSNPVWNKTWMIDFFRASKLRIEVADYKLLGRNHLIGYADIELCMFRLGEVSEVPLIQTFVPPNGSGMVSFELSIAPVTYSAFSMKPVKVHELYMFLSYDPNMQEPLEALPVTFRVNALVGDENVYSFFGDKADWTRIGYGGLGNGFLGPTGITHVGIIRACYFQRLKFIVEIVNKSYQGSITFHMVDMEISKKKGHYNLNSSTANKNRTVYEHTQAVPIGGVATVPMLFEITKKKLKFSDMDVCSLNDAASLTSFEDSLARRFLADSYSHQRNMLPRSEVVSLTEMCRTVGVDKMPNRVNLVLGIARMMEVFCTDADQVKMHAICVNTRCLIYASLELGLFGFRTNCPNGELVLRPQKAFQRDYTSFFSRHICDDVVNVEINLLAFPLDVVAIVVGQYAQNKNPAEWTHTLEIDAVPTSYHCGYMEYVRIFDSASAADIGVFQCRRSHFGSACSTYGALVRTGDTWSWVPIEQTTSEPIKIDNYLISCWSQAATKVLSSNTSI